MLLVFLFLSFRDGQCILSLYSVTLRISRDESWGKLCSLPLFHLSVGVSCIVLNQTNRNDHVKPLKSMEHKAHSANANSDSCVTCTGSEPSPAESELGGGDLC